MKFPPLLVMKISHFVYCISLLVFCERFVQYGYKGAISSTFVNFGEIKDIGNAYYHYFASILPFSAVIFCFLGDLYDSGRIVLGIFLMELTGLTFSWLAVIKKEKMLFKLAFILSAAGSGGLALLLPGLGRIYAQNKNFFLNIGYFINAGSFLGYYSENYFTKHHGHQITYLSLLITCVLMFIIFLTIFFISKKENYEPNKGKKPEKTQNSNVESPKHQSMVHERVNISSTEIPSEDVDGPTNIVYRQMPTFYIFLLYLSLIPYFSLKEQYNSSFKTLSSKLVDFVILKKDQVQIMNPLFYLVSVPVVKLLPYGMSTKIVLGYCLSILSFLVCLLIEKVRTDATSVVVMVIPFFFLAFGEVLCYTTNQEYAYEIASSERKFFVLSFVRFMSFVGNIIVTQVYYSGILSNLTQTFTAWSSFGLIGCLVYTISLFVFERKRRVNKS